MVSSSKIKSVDFYRKILRDLNYSSVIANRLEFYSESIASTCSNVTTLHGEKRPREDCVDMDFQASDQDFQGSTSAKKMVKSYVLHDYIYFLYCGDALYINYGRAVFYVKEELKLENVELILEDFDYLQLPCALKEVIEINSDTSVAEAVKIMAQHSILSVPVVDVDAPEDATWIVRYLGIIEYAGIVVWILHQ
ncbi:hypothetical protein POM88_035533 [Heracleum sosnowskyi]|uniref:CBS domain-containing protein n=1 Tax=Heracleum sosnowskyi TaxID=360622 RepID=A0AAD8HLS7_9APIA|nr:hypothetical protein POM88_035533 [Heracleum sosnowskyi]